MRDGVDRQRVHIGRIRAFHRKNPGTDVTKVLEAVKRTVLELEKEGVKTQGQQCVELRKPPARAHLGTNRSRRELVLSIRLARLPYEGISEIRWPTDEPRS